MKIEDLFGQLYQNQLAFSQVHFSVVWLGRSARYYSHLTAIRGQPGLATLVALEWRLRSHAAFVKGPSAVVLNELAQRLRAHIETRSILDVRRRSSSQ